MALQAISDNIQQAPATPGKQVRQLKSELEAKDSQIDDLTKALSGLNFVKSKIDLSENSENNKVNGKKTSKRDVDAPVPAKTAYKFFSDATPKQEGADMRIVWKEAAPEMRQAFTLMAEADKARFTRENAVYEQEKLALEMFYAKQKQDAAMEFYEAHIAANAALENSEANKTKKSKAKKDPEAPKRPLSSYMYFVKEKRETVSKDLPEGTAPTEIVKTLGEMWNKLQKGKAGKNGTKKYDTLAAKDKARYDAEKAVYDEMIAQRNIESAQQKADQFKQDKEEAMKLFESVQMVSDTPASVIATGDDASVSVVTGDDKKKALKKKKDPNAPKRASSAYIFFTTTNRAEIKSKMAATVTNTELLTEIGRQWKELSEKQKEKYNKMNTADKERYAKEMETYTPLAEETK